MYYWSRWTNITTTDARTNEARNTRPSWQDPDYRLALRETRPVVVVARSRTQAPSMSSGHQRGQACKRDASPRISLDVRRSRSYTTAPRSQDLTSWEPDAVTQPVLVE